MGEKIDEIFLAVKSFRSVLDFQFQYYLRDVYPTLARGEIIHLHPVPAGHPSKDQLRPSKKREV